MRFSRLNGVRNESAMYAVARNTMMSKPRMPKVFFMSFGVRRLDHAAGGQLHDGFLAEFIARQLTCETLETNSMATPRLASCSMRP